MNSVAFEDMLVTVQNYQFVLDRVICSLWSQLEWILEEVGHTLMVWLDS